MASLASIVDLAESVNQSQANFLKVEVALAQTFSSIALKAKNPEKRARNRRAARKAFDMVSQFMGRVTLTNDDALWLESNLQRLKFDLATLGELL